MPAGDAGHGDNPDHRSFGVNTDAQKILGLRLSNALVGLAAHRSRSTRASRTSAWASA
ncbi:hypothetical protein QJS66_00030 [Kocuria rhizophila]|nr:hypothetical protein QJS66_00030 [Kocuria rhizophila]